MLKKLGKIIGIVLAVLMTASTVFAAGSGDWSMYGSDPTGSRYNSAEKKLSTSSVANLAVRWQLQTATIVTGTPVVVDNVVYVAEAGGGGGFGGTGGTVYALNGNNGSVIWKTTVPGSTFTATATVMRGRVVIGDTANGNIYGFDQSSGKLLWTIQPNTTGKPSIWGSGTQVGKYLAIGVASNEEIFPTTDFHSRGSVVLLDPNNGNVIWQTYTISDADFALGASGASVWVAPAYDADTNTIFIGTGNNFSLPTTGTSDAMMALDANTGAIKWINQLLPNDSWNPWTHGSGYGPDFDIGDSPQIYNLPNGRKVVGVGQKSGVYHVLDPITGAAINSTGLTSGSGSTLGGLFSDSAVANGVVYANGNTYPTAGGGSVLLAFSADNNGSPTVLWTFQPNSFYALSGVAVANGVVYFTAAMDPNLYAIDAATGNVLKAVNIGASTSGPSISNGQVYVGTGSVFISGSFTSPGTVTALGIK